jgi:hypothetical protein
MEGNTDPVRPADDQASADTTAGTVSMGQADATAETNFTTGTEASVQNNTNDKCIALDMHSTFTPQSDPIIERQLYNRDPSGNAHVATITNAIICSESWKVHKCNYVEHNANGIVDRCCFAGGCCSHRCAAGLDAKERFLPLAQRAGNGRAGM